MSGFRASLWVPVRQEVGTGTVLGIAFFPDLLVKDPLSSEGPGFGLKGGSFFARTLCSPTTWVVVTIKIPFLGTLNYRCRIIIGTPKRDHDFDNHPHASALRLKWVMISSVDVSGFTSKISPAWSARKSAG